ncbi:MAG: glycosyltransferase family 4 protein [Magnetococcales bacterium]|nr:glycosyltransferase family 4 protein [Magnetococcales bacterium]
MHIGFVSGLSDHKLSQKLAPLQAMEEVEKITLFRRQRFVGEKVYWQPMPEFASKNQWLGDSWRMGQLLLRSSKCDLLVGCHQRFHGVLAALTGKIFKIPTAQLVITEFDVMWGHPAYNWAIRQAMLVGVRGQKAKARCLESLKNSKTVTFVPPNLFDCQTPPLPDLHTNRDIDVLYVGSFTNEKNIPMLVEILKGIKDKIGSLQGAVIGRGPWGKFLRLELIKQQLHNDVNIIDHIPQDALAAYYQRAKLLLLPSRSEGFPMVIPEAMSWATPVVATDVGDISDIITHGKNGFLHANDDCGGLVASCVAIIDNDKLSSVMRANARKALDEFVVQSSLAKAVAQWRQAFVQLTDSGLLLVKK